MERLVKLIKESNPLLSVAKDVHSSQSAVGKIWYKDKWNEVIKKEKKNILVDFERNQSVRMENWKHIQQQIEIIIKKKYINKQIKEVCVVDCKKFLEWHVIFIGKSQMKTSSKFLTEGNKVRMD